MNPHRIRTWVTWGLVGLGVVSAGCRPPALPAERTFTAMGTVASVQTALEDRGRIDPAAARMQGLLGDLERELSIYREDSEISRLNRMAGQGPVTVGPAAREVLALARRFNDWSDGTFDVTIGPLVRLWGFSGGHAPAAIPSSNALEAVRQRIGLSHLVMASNTACLDQPGMYVDLGGIAKGYAVDKVYEALRAQGMRNLLVNLGGNMRAGGAAAANRPWRVGVRNPFNRETILGIMTLSEGEGTATSGNYERYVEIDGRRYAHILDPRSGWPVQGMAGVTVVAPTAGDADGWSTSLFVLGPDEGTRRLRTHAGVEALWVPDRQPMELIVTPGFARRFTPLPEYRDRIRVREPAGSAEP